MSEAELEAIAKGGADAGMDVDVDGAGGEATRRLLGDYQTPARYPFLDNEALNGPHP